MRAILLAGGQGSRLWPVCAGRSKCLAPLPGGTVLRRALEQLARSGVDRVLVTLSEDTVQREQLAEQTAIPGVEVTFRQEERPLGTAGALAACADFVEEEDFLAVCGDVVWDFDLAPALALHRARRAAVTLTLAHSVTPERYGAAACDRLGRVVYFEEKPPLARCESMTINTGVCVCSPAVFPMLKPGDDLARDLFPRLMEDGGLWAVPVRGYWRDVGTPSDLLTCAADLLDRRMDPCGQMPEPRPGVYSAQPLPDGVEFIPPCWLGPGVRIGSGSLIGPHAVLTAGTEVGPRSLVQRSLVDGARLGGRSTLYGAVVCPGVRTGECCVLNEGVVVGEGAVLGDNAVLMERVRVAPGEAVAPSARLAAGKAEAVLPAFRPEGDGKNSLYFSQNI